MKKKKPKLEVFVGGKPVKFQIKGKHLILEKAVGKGESVTVFELSHKPK